MCGKVGYICPHNLMLVCLQLSTLLVWNSALFHAARCRFQSEFVSSIKLVLRDEGHHCPPPRLRVAN